MTKKFPLVFTIHMILVMTALIFLPSTIEDKNVRAVFRMIGYLYMGGVAGYQARIKEEETGSNFRTRLAAVLVACIWAGILIVYKLGI